MVEANAEDMKMQRGLSYSTLGISIVQNTIRENKLRNDQGPYRARVYGESLGHFEPQRQCYLEVKSKNGSFQVEALFVRQEWKAFHVTAADVLQRKDLSCATAMMKLCAPADPQCQVEAVV
jgi:hypothetical protein